MNNDSKRNNIIIGALLITIALMTIGYAALATQSTINNNSNNTTSDTWNVEFESITKNATLTTPSAKEIALPTANSTAITFNIELSEPGSKITYDLTVVNNGSIDATLNNILGIDELNANVPKEITYEIQKLDNGNSSKITDKEDLLAKGRNHFRVTIKLDDNANESSTESKVKAGTIYLNYIQKTNKK